MADSTNNSGFPAPDNHVHVDDALSAAQGAAIRVLRGKRHARRPRRSTGLHHNTELLLAGIGCTLGLLVVVALLFLCRTSV